MSFIDRKNFGGLAYGWRGAGLALLLAGAARAQTPAVPSAPAAAPVGPAAVAAADPEWAGIEAALTKLAPAELKVEWAKNESAMRDLGGQAQQARQELWKATQEARLKDPACIAIRAQMDQLRKQLDEAALKAPAVAPLAGKSDALQQDVMKAMKKRQLMGRLLRSLPDAEQFDAAKSAAIRPASGPVSAATTAPAEKK